MKSWLPLLSARFFRRAPVLAGHVLILTGLLMPQGLSGATAVSRIFGAVPVVADGAADTVLSLPLNVPAVFRATVASVADSTITFSGTPNLTPDEFVYVEDIQPQTFYLFFESGDLAGRGFTVVGNSTTSVTLTQSDEIASQHSHPSYMAGLQTNATCVQPGIICQRTVVIHLAPVAFATQIFQIARHGA